MSRFEPALPRRKKHPELAYKTHEFLRMSEAGGSDDSLDFAVPFDRARVSIFCTSCCEEFQNELREPKSESLLTLPDRRNNKGF